MACQAAYSANPRMVRIGSSATGRRAWRLHGSTATGLARTTPPSTWTGVLTIGHQHDAPTLRCGRLHPTMRRPGPLGPGLVVKLPGGGALPGHENAGVAP